MRKSPRERDDTVCGSGARLCVSRERNSLGQKIARESERESNELYTYPACIVAAVAAEQRLTR